MNQIRSNPYLKGIPICDDCGFSRKTCVCKNKGWKIHFQHYKLIKWNEELFGSIQESVKHE